MSQQHRGQETEELTYREAIQSAMVEEMERDDDAFLMGEDVAEFGGVFGASQGMLDQFGEERPRSLSPLDTDTIAESVRKTGRLVVADESWVSYGTHAELVARLSQEAFYDLDAPIQRVGVPDVHVPYAPELEDEVLPDGEDVRDAVERLF